VRESGEVVERGLPGRIRAAAGLALYYSKPGEVAGIAAGMPYLRGHVAGPGDELVLLVRTGRRDGSVKEKPDAPLFPRAPE
jgi:hypothetical protein